MALEARSIGRRAGAWLAILALGAVLVYTPGCYRYRVTAFDEDDAVLKFHETRHALFWGLVSEPILLTPTADDPSRRCESNSLYEVRVSTNFGCALATVLTLGIWAPAEVEWTCAARPVVTGDFGEPPPDADDEEEPSAAGAADGDQEE